jgi:arsenate reductase-like glutaredoxin family protein
MSWMKYIASLAEDPTALSSMRKALQTANKHGLNYAIYNGESYTTEKLRAMIRLVEKAQSNDSLHRDSDHVNTGE